MLFQPRPKFLGKDAFVRMKDGEEVAGVFRGSVHTFRQHWVANRGTVCMGPECPLCKSDPDKKPAFRFRVNFVTTIDGKYIAKIFEGSGTTYDALTALNKKFNIEDMAVEITRRGTGQQTAYQFLPMVQQPLSAEMKKAIAAAPLLPLSSEAIE